VPLKALLDVWALGEVVSHYSGPGTGFVGLKVDSVRILESSRAPWEQCLSACFA